MLFCNVVKFQREQAAPHIKDSELLFGDNFSERRPDWCLLMKLTQGLGDCLFCNKFADWKQFIATPSGKWETPVKKAKILTADEEETAATELAR